MNQYISSHCAIFQKKKTKLPSRPTEEVKGHFGEMGVPVRGS